MSNFRNWVTAKWFEHRDEILEFTKEPVKYNEAEYFRKYKWWLKREYKHQRGK